MEEESTSEILDGEIVGITFALASHHEIVSYKSYTLWN